MPNAGGLYYCSPSGCFTEKTRHAARVLSLINKIDVTHWYKCVSGNPSDDIDPLLIKQHCTDATSQAWFSATFKNPKAMELTIRDVRVSLVKFYKLPADMKQAILQRYKVPSLPARYSDFAYYQSLDFKLALRHHEEITRLSDTVRYRDFKIMDDLEKVEEMTGDDPIKDLLRRQAESLRLKDSALLQQEGLLKASRQREHKLLAQVDELKEKLNEQRLILETRAAIDKAVEHEHLKSLLTEQETMIRGFKHLLSSAVTTNEEISKVHAAAERFAQAVRDAFDEFEEVACKKAHPAFSQPKLLSPISIGGGPLFPNKHGKEGPSLYNTDNTSYTTFEALEDIAQGQDAAEIAKCFGSKSKSSPSEDVSNSNYTARKDSVGASDHSKVPEDETGLTSPPRNIDLTSGSHQEPRTAGTGSASGEREDFGKRIRRKFSKKNLFSRLGA